MAQIRAGTVSVTADSATVIGVGTAWATTVDAGDLFNITGSSAIYQIIEVTDDSTLILSRTYKGVTESGVTYSITRDFTPRHSLPYAGAGDDVSAVLGELIRKLDAILPGEGAPGGQQGAPGESNYPQFAFANDTAGTGFSLKPTPTFARDWCLCIK